MKNIRILLKYDGTDFHGYQIQKNGYTVQEALSSAIYSVTGEKSDVIGCSRTDAGVHAKMYCANFFSKTKIPMGKLPLALNTKLPPSVRVNFAEIVEDGFHSTFSAKEKTYQYIIDTNMIADPFLSRYSWHYPYKIDFSKMKKASKYIVGKHDFSAFASAGRQTKTTVRTVKKIKLYRKKGIIKIEITADGFLYNMVRIIVGTLVYTGIGKIKTKNIPDIILSHDRSKAGITAPPEGLTLISVVY